jgi:hypothetical protein
MNLDLLGYVLIIFIIIIVYKIYSDSDMAQLKCIISDVDGNKYCVRERKKLNEAADHLAEVSVNLKLLVKDCQENFPDTEITKNLTKGFNPKKIIETLPTSEFTAYSENKGEKLAFCLEKEKGKSKLIDINTLTFVAIHELAHIASTQVGHGDEFWNNFKFLLVRAKENNIYKPQDYKKQPEKYCGMEITDNPYFDL